RGLLAGTATSTGRSCPKGSYYVGVGEPCNLCEVGSYKKNAGSQACTKCSVGYTSAVGSAAASDCVFVACPANTFSALSSNELIDCTCLAGYFGADGTACTACVAGTYKTETGDVSCTVCGVDTYSATVAAASADTCSSCPANTFSLTGSSVITACTCLAGYSGSDGTACAPCPAGSYKNVTGDVECTPCAVDHYSDVPARTDVCGACPAFTFSLQGGNELTDCSCLAGYNGANGTECAACP
ncbi:hypothetical protein T484DRAFT_1577207, partial [Baffinella frigidus]